MKRLYQKGIRMLALTLVIAAICSVAAFAAEVKVGVVNVSTTLNLRSSRSTTSSVLAQAANGSKVVVLEKSGDWYKVIYKQITGYMHVDYVKLLTSSDFAIGPGVINASSVNFRKSPSLSAGVITVFGKNKKLDVIGIEDGWYKVTADGKTGYVYPDYVTISGSSSTTAAVSATSSSSSSAGSASSSSSTAAAAVAPAVSADSSDKDALRAEIIAYAKQFLGCSYKYGTMNGKTFDCSGFTSYVYQHFGYSLNRSAAGQVSNGTKVASKDQLKPGDIVCFRDPSINTGAASHVGIYVGDGQFIHCSSGGGCVKYNYLSDSYYSRYYVGARRIIG